MQFLILLDVLIKGVFIMLKFLLFLFLVFLLIIILCSTSATAPIWFLAILCFIGYLAEQDFDFASIVFESSFIFFFFLLHLFYILMKKIWIVFLIIFIGNFADTDNLSFAIYMFSLIVLFFVWIIYAIATFQNNFLNI